jgi:hypothetical protein
MSHFLSATLPFLLVLWGGCSDDAETTPPQDGAADVTTADGRADVDRSPDAGADQAPTPEVGTDLQATDLQAADQGSDAAAGHVCKSAIPITLTAGSGTASGQILSSDTDDDVNLPASSCVGATTPGVDRFYAVSLTAGKSYVVSVSSPGKLAPALYVFTDCASVASTCLAGGAPVGAMPSQQVTVTPKASGVHVIAVDSAYPAGNIYAYGSYTLSINESSGNDTCAKAQALAWSGGTATTSGTLTGAANTVTLGSTDCAQIGTPGPDLFYSVDLKAGTGYTITATASLKLSLYVFTDCAKVAATCVAGDPYYNSLKLTAKTTGKHIIGVDYGQPSLPPGAPATFTLTVKSFTPPANDSCAKAQALSFSNGKATATGSLDDAGNTVNLPSSSCVKTTTPGPDLFYSFPVTAGQGYRVTATSTAAKLLSLYAFTDCAKVASTCLAGNDSYPSTPGSYTLSFIAASGGSVLLGVDLFYALTPGFPSHTFSLTVEQFTPAANSTCAQAQALSFSAGVAKATGDTSASSNDLAGVKCSGTSTFDGPQLYYSVALKAGVTYEASLTPASSFDAALYAFPAAVGCTATAINPACYYTYSSAPGPGLPEKVKITPTTAGDWILAVDSNSVTSAGTFTLEVK